MRLKIKIIILLAYISSLYAIDVNAADVRLYVGDNILFAAPMPPRGATYDTSWDDCGNLEFSIIKNSDKYSAKIYMHSKFTGIKTFNCTVFYYWYQNNVQYTNRQTYTYTIECLGDKPGSGGGGTGGGGSVGTNELRFVDGDISMIAGQMYRAEVNSVNYISKIYWTVGKNIANVKALEHNTHYADIEALSEGETYVQAQQDHESVRCNLKIFPKYPTSFKFEEGNMLDMSIGESHHMNSSIIPSEARYSLKFTSSDPDVISVINNFGTITARKAGTAIITAEISNQEMATCAITVHPIPTEIKLPENLEIYVGETIDIGPTITPADATALYSWIIENSDLLTISGMSITGVAEGETTIYCIANDVTSTISHVKVLNRQPTDIKLSEHELSVYVENTKQLKYTLTPSNARNDVRWEIISGDDVISIDQNGTITPIHQGEAVVKVQTYNGLRDMCKVTVTEPFFRLYSVSPKEGSQKVSSDVKINLYFSIEIFEGTKFDKIELRDIDNNQTVDLNIKISKQDMYLRPVHGLESLTNYQLFLPKGAICNQWGTIYPDDIVLNFSSDVNMKDVEYLSIWNNDGSKISIPLNERPKFTFDYKARQIHCVTRNRDVFFSMSNVHKYAFELSNTVVTEINEVKALQENFISEPGHILFNNYNTGDVISLYDIGGNLIDQCLIHENGSGELSTQNLKKGIYIIKSKNNSYKFVVK